MTTEQIDQRLTELQTEQTNLAAAHERMVQQYQQAITNNQNRFQQIKGGIDELTKLKNGAT